MFVVQKTLSLSRSPQFGTLKPYTEWTLFPEPVLDSFQKKYQTDGYSYAFGGDNYGPAHPEYLKIMNLALSTSHITYQHDSNYGNKIGRDALKAFKKVFCQDPDRDPLVVAFPPTGTASNRIGLSPVLKPTEAIIAASNSHAVMREAGANITLNNAGIYEIPHENGKISINFLSSFLKEFNDWDSWNYAGNRNPKVITITQPTEYGVLYSDDEVKEIVKIARNNNLLVQMDASRLLYAAAALNRTLKSLTTDLGVDIVALGGSKHKMALAEALVYTPNFFKHAKNYSRHDKPDEFQKEIRNYMKQSGHLVGQTVAAAAQFTLALEDDFGINLLKPSLEKAKKLESLLLKIKDTELYLPTETNVVMVTMPQKTMELIDKKYEIMAFKEKPKRGEGYVVTRFMTNANTNEKDLQAFEVFLKENNLLRL